MPYKSPLKGVYVIKVKGTDYVYIGSSSNIKQRYNLHLSAIKRADDKRSCKALHDLCTEGHSMELVILELCENLLEREQFWIGYYQKEMGYKLLNVFDADRKNSSVKEEFREKMSAIRKIKWQDPTYRNNQLKRLKPTQFKKKGSV